MGILVAFNSVLTRLKLKALKSAFNLQLSRIFVSSWRFDFVPVN